LFKKGKRNGWGLNRERGTRKAARKSKKYYRRNPSREKTEEGKKLEFQGSTIEAFDSRRGLGSMVVN